MKVSTNNRGDEKIISLSRDIVKRMFVPMLLFWGVSVLELALWLIPSLRLRRPAGTLVFLLVVGTSLVLIGAQPGVLTLMLAFVSAYRACNLLRLIKARIHDKYLRRAGVQSSLWLIGAQGVTFCLWWLGYQAHISAATVWLVLSGLSLIAGIVLLLSTVRSVWKTREPQLATEAVVTADLPSLTVAIPARNETDDLEACLSSIIGSNYPKLEILVLDDCSQDKRTPEIIRSYAHSGVRFLQGAVPEDNWLAKNQAYQQLLDEANGEYILFCGVDTRFSPDSFRLLIVTMLHKHKTMLSLIPRNVVPAALSVRSSTLLQPMRYAWELALPRRLFRRPPVLSTCWIAKRDLLTSAGGFGAVSRSVVPESYFARVSAVHDGYSFMRSSERIGVASSKSLDEQQATAVRTRYPQVHRRIELVCLLTVAESVGLIWPFMLLALALAHGYQPSFVIISALTVAILIATYAILVTLTYRVWLVRSLVLLPMVAYIDIVLLNYSMIRYEFFDVEWKGRNVCIPVMRVVDHLPPLPDTR